MYKTPKNYYVSRLFLANELVREFSWEWLVNTLWNFHTLINNH